MRRLKKDSPFKILLAVDNSPHSAAAVSLMTHITWPAETSVYMLTAVSDQLPLMETNPDIRCGVDETVEINRWRDWAATKIFTTQTAKVLQTHHLTVEQTEICEGQLADITSERAIALSVDLIVIGAENIDETNEPWPYSAVYKLTQYGQWSVLVVRPSEQIRPLTTILAVDDSLKAWRTVEFVCTLSLPDWAKITLVNVAEEAVNNMAGVEPAGRYYLPADPWSPEPDAAGAYIAEITGYLQDCGVQVRRSMRFGHPANEILSAAHEQDADLIIVGTRSQTRANAFGLDEVSRKIIRYTPCSVLVVR